MKLKYYLRGMGIGIILTAIVMGFALGGRKATISDAEVIQRAKALGMVDGEAGVLLDSQNPDSEETGDDSSTSDSTLFEKGDEVSKEEHQEVTEANSSVSDLASQTQEGEGSAAKASEAVSISSASASKEESASADSSKINNEAAVVSSIEDTTAATEPSTSEEQEVLSASTGSDSAKTQNDTGSGSKTVTIPGGMGSDQVAQILFNEGIVDNAVTFNRYLVDNRVDRIIRSGVKTFPQGASYEQIAAIITK